MTHTHSMLIGALLAASLAACSPNKGNSDHGGSATSGTSAGSGSTGSSGASGTTGSSGSSGSSGSAECCGRAARRAGRRFGFIAVGTQFIARCADGAFVAGHLTGHFVDQYCAGLEYGIEHLLLQPHAVHLRALL